MKKATLIWFAIVATVLVFGGSALAQSGTGQASLTLWSCNTGSCYSDNTSWSLGKCEGAGCTVFPNGATPDVAVNGGQNETGLASGSTVHWNVGVQSFAVSAHVFKVFGFLDMQNTGSDTAYLGSLVINLQTKQGPKFTTAVSDVTNSTVGDAATQGITCQGASSDGTTFIYTEGTGSGPLKLYDSSHNDLIAMKKTLAAGERLVLLYEADFNIDAAHINAGDQVRIEALVTFSNAGPRGGSGASCTNPGSTNFGTTNLGSFNDINGDGKYTADELYYRTVPCRTSFTVPALTHDNQTVTLSDPVTNASDNPIFNVVFDANNLEGQAAGLTAVDLQGTLLVQSAKTNIGTLDLGGFGSGIQNLTSNGSAHSYPYVVDATATLIPDNTGNGLAGLDNCTTLTSPDDLVVVNDPNSTASFTFTCNKGENQKACAWPLFSVTAPPPPSGSACTYTQGAWGGKPHGSNAGSFLLADYLKVYPSGSVTIGWPSAAGHTSSKTMTFSGGTKNIYTCDKNHKNCVVSGTIPFTMVDSIEAYLPAGGTAAALNATLVNPVDSSSGNFGGQVLTLQLNVDFGDKGYGWPVTAPVGDVVMHTAGCETGKSVRAILADANIVLGGGPLPTGCSSVSTLSSVVDYINNFFDECKKVDNFNSSSNLSFSSN